MLKRAKRRATAGVAAAATAMLLATTPASADSFNCPLDNPAATRTDTARALFEEALQLEASDPEAALLRLLCAEKLVERASVALRIGMIAERIGRRDQAITAFESYLRRAGDAAPDRAEIEQRIAALRVASREASEPTPPPPTSADDPRPRIAGIVIASLGGAAAIAGGALLAVAKSHSDEVHDIAPLSTDWGSDEASGLYDQALVEQGVGIALLVGGGALLAGGLGVALWPSDDQTTDSVSLRLAPGGAALRLSF